MAKQSIPELAKSVGLPQQNTQKVVEMLKHDIIVSLYRYSPETDHDHDINKKVQKIYQSLYGVEFDPKVEKKNKKLPLFLMGPPGQGKTASYIAAATEVCELMGLNFISHVTDDYKPSENDFVMVVQECAGENSAITFGGVPKAEEITLPNGQKQSVLKKALNYRFTVFSRCAGGVLLFDDAANAASVIQNVLLPVAQNSSFQGLKIPNALIGFTGNLGALDGTYVAEQSSALLTRVIPMFVTDTVQDFLNRAIKYYDDELGDLGFLAFLKRNEKDFSDLPQSGQKSGFACSRSHDNFIQSARSIVQRNGGRGRGEARSLGEIHNLARSCYGYEFANKLIAYYDSYIQGADPLAKEFIINGKKDMETLSQKYANGASVQNVTFGYQFATACGDYAVNSIAKIKRDHGDKTLSIDDKEVTKVIARFAGAMTALNSSEFSYSIEHFKNKLAIYVSDFSQDSKSSIGKELTSKTIEHIARVINDDENCDYEKRKALISTITDYNKLASASFGAKKSSRAKLS